VGRQTVVLLLFSFLCRGTNFFFFFLFFCLFLSIFSLSLVSVLPPLVLSFVSSFSPFSFTIFLLVLFLSASISLLFLSCFSLSQNLPSLPVSHPLVFIKGERGDSHPTLSNRA